MIWGTDMVQVVKQYVLIGPYQGQDRVFSGHQFVNGVHEYRGDDSRLRSVDQVLGMFGAMRTDSSEFIELYGGEAEVVQDEPDEPRGHSHVPQALVDAIKGLDPDALLSWTNSGLPAIAEVSKISGMSNLTRAVIADAVPGWTREVAASERDKARSEEGKTQDDEGEKDPE